MFTCYRILGITSKKTSFCNLSKATKNVVCDHFGHLQMTLLVTLDKLQNEVFLLMDVLYVNFFWHLLFVQSCSTTTWKTRFLAILILLTLLLHTIVNPRLICLLRLSLLFTLIKTNITNDTLWSMEDICENHSASIMTEFSPYNMT